MSSDKSKRIQDAAIENNLRLLYQPLLEEEVPERFRKLLDDLAQSKSQKEGVKE